MQNSVLSELVDALKEISASDYLLDMHRATVEGSIKLPLTRWNSHVAKKAYATAAFYVGRGCFSLPRWSAIASNTEQAVQLALLGDQRRFGLCVNKDASFEIILTWDDPVFLKTLASYDDKKLLKAAGFTFKPANREIDEPLKQVPHWAIAIQADYDQEERKSLRKVVNHFGARIDIDISIYQFAIAEPPEDVSIEERHKVILAEREKSRRTKLLKEARKLEAILLAGQQRRIEAGSTANRKEYEEMLAIASLDNELANGWTLKEHQKAGIKWLLATRHVGLKGRILADAPGVGKTVQALVAANTLRSMFGLEIMIICPASVKPSWQSLARDLDIPIQLSSWSKVPESNKSNQYLVIGDESHMAKSGVNTRRGQRFLALSSHENCYTTWALTGTPLPNGRSPELIPLLQSAGHLLVMQGANDLLDGKSPLSVFKKTYCFEGDRGPLMSDFNEDGTVNEDVAEHKTKTLLLLHSQMRDVILRRTKADVLTLPSATKRLKEVQLSAQAKVAYDERIEAALDLFESGLSSRLDLVGEFIGRARGLRGSKSFKVDASMILGKKARQFSEDNDKPLIITKDNALKFSADLYQWLTYFKSAESLTLMTRMIGLSSEYKVPFTLKEAIALIKAGKKPVVLASSINALNALVYGLNQKGFALEGITADMNTKKRKGAIARFQSGHADAFLSTIKCAGIGITLTASSSIIMHDRPWDYGSMVQANDRINRIGQQRETETVWMRLKDSIDGKIDGAIANKGQNVDLVLTGKGEYKPVEGASNAVVAEIMAARAESRGEDDSVTAQFNAIADKMNAWQASNKRKGKRKKAAIR